MVAVGHKYTPAAMPRLELSETFAARHHTLDYLLDSLREQKDAGTLTSFLLTGQRGAGKTTLLLMLKLRIEADRELRSHWRPVLLNEELPAASSLRDLLLCAVEALADDGDALAEEALPSLEAESDDDSARRHAINCLQAVSEEDGSRLILMIENLNDVFENAIGNESAALRQLLMVEPFMMLIGTGIRSFPALESYDAPLYNYFTPVPLERLDDDAVEELLLKRAEFDQDRAFEFRLATFRFQIRTLARLAGGNPRFLLMLYELLTEGCVIDVVQTLRKLLDELTPHMQGVLKQMSTQQRKVLDAVMRCGGSASPAEVSRRTHIDLSSVTSQLGRLKQSQILDLHGGGKGRQAIYSVPDQLFLTWYRMRYLRTEGRRITILVELLRCWFDSDELMGVVDSFATRLCDGVARATRNDAATLEYFAAALEGTSYAIKARDTSVQVWITSGELAEAAAALSDLDPTSPVVSSDRKFADWALSHENDHVAINALAYYVETHPDDWKAHMGLGASRGRLGQYELALPCFSMVLKQSKLPDDHKGVALFLRGVTHAHLGDQESAIADYTQIIDLVGLSPAAIARALFNRGIAHGQLGRHEAAAVDYSRLIELAGAPEEKVIVALVNRGNTLTLLENHSAAVDDFTRVIERTSALASQVAMALFNRGVAHGQAGNQAAATEDYKRVAELDGAPVEEVAKALYQRGVILESRGNDEAAISTYSRAIELESAPPSLVAKALNNRGVVFGRRGDLEAAIVDFESVIRMDGALVDEVASSLYNRGNSLGRIGDRKAAIEYFGKVLELDGVRLHQVAKTLYIRGCFLAELEDYRAAIEDYTRLIGLKQAQPAQVASALYNRGVARGRLNEIEAAMADYSRVIRMSGAPPLDVVKACNNRGICHDRLGDNEAAIADYTRAIELEDAAPPQIANALLNRGVTQGQLGNAAAALADYTRIVELKEAPPEHMVLALVNRATAHSVLGDARSETEDLRAALELSAREPTLQMHNLIHPLAKTCWRLLAATGERHRLKGKIDALFGTMQESAKLALGTAFLTIAQRHGDARLWCESWDYLIALENAPIQENLGPLVAVRAHLGGAGDALHPLAVEERVFAQEFLSGFKEAG